MAVIWCCVLTIQLSGRLPFTSQENKMSFHRNKPVKQEARQAERLTCTLHPGGGTALWASCWSGWCSLCCRCSRCCARWCPRPCTPPTRTHNTKRGLSVRDTFKNNNNTLLPSIGFWWRNCRLLIWLHFLYFYVLKQLENDDRCRERVLKSGQIQF